jgi:hypothetical protein
MTARRLVVCLNRRHVRGRLYTLADRGRRTVNRTFGLDVPRPPQRVDWRKYARVMRGQTRRLVLLELANVAASEASPATTTAVRKRLGGVHPLGLKPTIRALRELEALGLAKSAPLSERGLRRVFTLTKAGAAHQGRRRSKHGAAVGRLSVFHLGSQRG